MDDPNEPSVLPGDCTNTLKMIKEKHSRTALLKKTFDEITKELRTKKKEIESCTEAIASNEQQLKEQLKVLTSLESDAEQKRIRISIWKKILNEKTLMLEKEKQENEVIKKNYLSERIRYCDSINEFLGKDSIPGSLENHKLNELKNTINLLEKELKEQENILLENELHQQNVKSKRELIAEEQKYRKLLQERQAELTRINYKIKLKKLEKNRNFVRNNSTPTAVPEVFNMAKIAIPCDMKSFDRVNIFNSFPK